ncbi:hypothetical protein BC936DRAFT_148463 [Jimgerdemannia flammicorona]|uniref:Uncharacterized protein n=1 Tax=Jimgerdemannia flammicorona TaxID=994334 RepID=A0A433DKH8_9FUNG|nr:hypothetical protein BC936DRAFT_148463 [Jimgerdemannia flammicorona]
MAIVYSRGSQRECWHHVKSFYTLRHPRLFQRGSTDSRITCVADTLLLSPLHSRINFCNSLLFSRLRNLGCLYGRYVAYSFFFQATRPPGQATRPPGQATRPPIQATRPPIQAIRPPIQAIRPPIQATRPPIQATSAYPSYTSAHPSHPLRVPPRPHPSPS